MLLNECMALFRDFCIYYYTCICFGYIVIYVLATLLYKFWLYCYIFSVDYLAKYKGFNCIFLYCFDDSLLGLASLLCDTALRLRPRPTMDILEHE
jgi:hypothetical protein